MQALGLAEEQRLWHAGYRRVAGLDEAGRGAWAGPVVAAAVVLPAEPAIADQLAGVIDSKQLSPTQRSRLAPLIVERAAATGVGVVAAQRIDQVGIAAATREAMALAVARLDPAPDFLLIDFVRLAGMPIPQASLVKGDCRVLSIAAASVLAKVTRDRLMDELALRFPAYGFERHKGYGTAQHQAALAAWGPSPEHRLSFAPVDKRQLLPDDAAVSA